MSEMKHTAEPWRVEYESDSRGRFPIPYIVAGDDPVAGDANDENSARIVQCVNACAGIEDPVAYERAVIAQVRTTLDIVEAVCEHAGVTDAAKMLRESFSALTPKQEGTET